MMRVLFSPSSNTFTKRVDFDGTNGANPYFTTLLSDELITLPVTLSDFTAELSNGNALLNWKTAQELNTRSFEIQRSANASNYSAIGQMVASGNSTGARSYHFTDTEVKNAGNGVVYYRLKQIDNDGKFTYSKVVTVMLKSNAETKLSPNPVADVANLLITIAGPSKAQWQIIDMHGATVRKGSVSLEKGTNHIGINLNTLIPGAYQLLIRGENIENQLKFVKQ